MSYNSDKILWIKNVKQVIDGDWAYDNKNDLNCNKSFQLHWSSAKIGGGSAKRANVGDIIVLFQKPYRINGKRNYKAYLTHLVTPITKDVSINENFPRHKHCREIKLLAIAEPLNAIPVSEIFKFSKVGRGLTNKIEHLISKEELHEKQVKDRIWELFQGYFCENIVLNINE